MVGLRIGGLILGLIFIISGFSLFRKRIIKNLNLVVLVLIGSALCAVSINPAVADILIGILSFKKIQFSRMLALLIASNFLLWVFIVYFNVSVDRKGRDIDILLQRIGLDEFFAYFHEVTFNNVTIVIPAHNELENLKILLRDVRKAIQGLPVTILVVDDGSTDETVRYLKSNNYYVAINKINRGGGAALQLGFAIAQKAGSSIVVTMDADNQHNPRFIPDLLKPILEDNNDIVIGSRTKGENKDKNKMRALGLTVYNALVSFLTGIAITDCSSGYRAFRLDRVASLQLSERQYHTSELIIEAAKKKLKITEIPIIMQSRYDGKSKKGNNWRYGLNFLRVILKTWWRD